jgi:hypothetical protein
VRVGAHRAQASVAAHAGAKASRANAITQRAAGEEPEKKVSTRAFPPPSDKVSRSSTPIMPYNPPCLGQGYLFHRAIACTQRTMLGIFAAPPTGRENHAWDAIPGLRSACPGLFSCLPSGKAAAIGPVRRPTRTSFDNRNRSCDCPEPVPRCIHMYSGFVLR